MSTDDVQGLPAKRVLGYDVNTLIADTLSWSYRTSYLLLALGFAAFYFGFCVIFALLYYWVAVVHPACINSGGVRIGDAPGAQLFSDCFHLSWTTFSTVGYGVISPATGASEFEVPSKCVGVGILGSFEAFVGVLYAGTCGAILFGKVLRSQNNAQVGAGSHPLFLITSCHLDV